MNKRTRCTCVAMVMTAIIVATTSPTSAQSVAEAECRDAIAKSLIKYTSASLKTIAACYVKRTASKVPPDEECNDPLLMSGTKMSRAYDRASRTMLAACPADLVGVLAQYARCPSPRSSLDDDGATVGIDDFYEATDCLLNLVASLVDGATDVALGMTEEDVTAGAATCRKTIGKALAKYTTTVGKVRRKCQSAADQAGEGVSYGCVYYDDGRIAAGRTSLEDAIARHCDVPLAELARLDMCGQSVEQLQECVGGSVGGRLGAGLIAAAYELPDTCKLGHVAYLLNAGNGRKKTVTNIDIGYNGLGHDADLVDGFEGAVDLACDDDCLDCAVTLAPVKSQGNSFCRCDGDPTIHCDTINGLDADDCAGGGCTCFAMPPLPVSAADAPACVVNKFTEDLDGIADGGTGAVTTTVSDRAVVYLGISQTQPCPVCLGDPTANDGLRGGTCSGGARDTLACDSNAVSPDFGPVSYECLPQAATNISGAGLLVTLGLTSVASPTIGADLLDGASPVFCLQCSGDTSIGCSSDAECAALGAGTCSANTGPPAHANGCSDGVCTAAAGAHTGTCDADLPDSFCDGLLRSNGRGLLPCIAQGDCDALDADCPGGDCGSCAHLQLRACYPDPLQAVGTHGIYGPGEESGVYGTELVSTFCVGATADAGINASVGLPGPQRLFLDTEFESRCASDPTVPFEAPGGSNCP